MTVQLQWGLSDELRLPAATLIYDSFIKKFRYTLGPRRKALPFIASQLRCEFGLVALLDGKLVGLAGAKTSQGELIHIRFGPLVKTYHIRLLRSLFVAFLFWFDKQEPGGLILSNLSVMKSARGHGIGTQMIQEFIKYGSVHGYRFVKLEVINSNLRAKSLYERLGFQTTKYSSIPCPWSHLLGFTGVYEMTYSLS